jgi:hypothetical protein
MADTDAQLAHRPIRIMDRVTFRDKAGQRTGTVCRIPGTYYADGHALPFRGYAVSCPVYQGIVQVTEDQIIAVHRQEDPYTLAKRILDEER